MVKILPSMSNHERRYMSTYVCASRKSISATSLLPLLLLISACDQSVNQTEVNKSSASDKLRKERCEWVYTPLARSNIHSALDIERAINTLIVFRKQNIVCPMKDVDLVSETEKIIGLIRENKSLYIRMQA